jgi:hypothetical protein
MAANSCREAAIGSAFKKILRCGGRLGWGCQGGLGNGALQPSGEASRALPGLAVGQGRRR